MNKEELVAEIIIGQLKLKMSDTKLKLLPTFKKTFNFTSPTFQIER